MLIGVKNKANAVQQQSIINSLIILFFFFFHFLGQVEILGISVLDAGHITRIGVTGILSI